MIIEFSKVGAVLKLGNISFVPATNMDGTEGCAITNDYGKGSSIYDVTQEITNTLKSTTRPDQISLILGTKCNV